MNINTKLILILTVTVGLVMFFASILFLVQREAALENALRDELRAHAVTLQIALEENYKSGRVLESRQLIDRLRTNSRIYAVILFDENGNLLTISQPQTETFFRQPPELKSVLESGETVEFIREVEGNKFLSIILPLRLDAKNFGALEIVKPLTLIRSDIQYTRINWLTTTLLLLAVIFLVVTVVLNRSLSKPFRSLLGGARALGRGDLQFRVAEPKAKDELALLTQEFNRMADSLEAQKRAAENEAENRLKLERELRHTERLASVGRLAAGIAHELGAPLNVIDARAELLLTKPDAPNEKREKNLTIIRSNVERITGIVRQLLTLARPFNFRLAEMKLNESLKETLDQFGQNAQKTNVGIEFLPNENHKIEADRDFLQQVWLNILQNALQAMPDGGKIKIETSAEERSGTKFAVVSFMDTGSGIVSDNLDKIFDPFYTTKDIGKGTGLGLSVAQRIVEEHGGFIEAKNNEQKGATFFVFLPLKT